MIEIIRTPGKMHFVEGHIVTKEELIDSGMVIQATGGAFGNDKVIVTEDVIVSNNRLYVGDTHDHVSMCYSDSQGHHAGVDLKMFVYAYDDPNVMFAHCIAYYSFDNDANYLENSMTRKCAEIVKSISNKPNMPKLTGTVFNIDSGMVGRALSLSSNTGEGVQLDTCIGTRDYTISMCVRPHTLDPDIAGSMFTPVFCAVKPDGSYMIFYAIYRSSEGFTIRTVIGGAEEELDPPYENVLVENQWSMLTLSVFDGEVSLYVNGEKMPAASNNNKLLNFFECGDTTLYLGTCPYDNTFMGDYDEVRLFDTALTEEQATLLFNQVVSDKSLTDEESKTSRD